MTKTEALIDALNVLKETCEDSEDCFCCPLGTNEGICKLIENIPRNYMFLDKDKIERVLF